MGKYLSCCSMGNTIGAYTRYIINIIIHLLGRCISYYKNKRGAEYCRLVQQHKAVRATAAVNVNKIGTVSQNVPPSPPQVTCTSLETLMSES